MASTLKTPCLNQLLESEDDDEELLELELDPLDPSPWLTPSCLLHEGPPLGLLLGAAFGLALAFPLDFALALLALAFAFPLAFTLGTGVSALVFAREAGFLRVSASFVLLSLLELLAGSIAVSSFSASAKSNSSSVSTGGTAVCSCWAQNNIWRRYILCFQAHAEVVPLPSKPWGHVAPVLKS